MPPTGSGDARMPVVPVRRLLIRVCNRKNFVIGKQVANDGRAKWLRRSGGRSCRISTSLRWTEAVRHDHGRMSGLIGQTDIALTAYVHVEVLHDLSHLPHDNETPTLRLHEIQRSRCTAATTEPVARAATTAATSPSAGRIGCSGRKHGHGIG